jgi:hypothetical protein
MEEEGEPVIVELLEFDYDWLERLMLHSIEKKEAPITIFRFLKSPKHAMTFEKAKNWMRKIIYKLVKRVVLYTSRNYFSKNIMGVCQFYLDKGLSVEIRHLAHGFPVLKSFSPGTKLTKEDMWTNKSFSTQKVGKSKDSSEKISSEKSSSQEKTPPPASGMTSSPLGCPTLKIASPPRLKFFSSPPKNKEPAFVHPEKFVHENRSWKVQKMIGKGMTSFCYQVVPLEVVPLEGVPLEVVPLERVPLEVGLECRKTPVVCKMILKSKINSEKRWERSMKEIEIHKKVTGHPHIVEFLESFDMGNEARVLLLKYYPKQSLREHINKKYYLKEEEAKRIFQQIVLGCQHIHAQNIIHRDLKLENIFLDEEMNVAIGDFGLSADYNPEHAWLHRTMLGTPNYISPEVLHGHRYSKEVDIWALGVILYTLLVGKCPFQSFDVKSTYKNIKTNKFIFPDNRFFSDNAKMLIRELLQSDPRKRPCFETILNHPFFTVPIPPKKDLLLFEEVF